MRARQIDPMEGLLSAVASGILIAVAVSFVYSAATAALTNMGVL